MKSHKRVRHAYAAHSHNFKERRRIFLKATSFVVCFQGFGGMAEWLKAAVLKTVVPQGTVGSNPTSSAIELLRRPSGRRFFVCGIQTPRVNPAADFALSLRLAHLQYAAPRLRAISTRQAPAR